MFAKIVLQTSHTNFMRKIVFDLETQKTFEQVGGQRCAAALGVSLLGAYDYNRGEYLIFREKDLGEFLRLLKETELLIGFNSRRFDLEVLRPYFPEFNLLKIPHLDILEEVYKSIGHRLKLDSLCKSTLFEGKIGNGLEAIHYYNAGDWASLARYCLNDTRITKDIYEYGRNHGRLWYSKAGKPEPIVVNFGGEKTVEEILREALANHEQVEITHLEADGEKACRLVSSIDIRDIKYGKVKAFCHKEKSDIIFDLAKIFSVKKNGARSTHQSALI